MNIVLETCKKSNKLIIYKIGFPEGEERKNKVEKDQERHWAKFIN